MKIIFKKMTAQQMLDAGITRAIYFNYKVLGAAISMGLFEAAHLASHSLRFAH